MPTNVWTTFYSLLPSRRQLIGDITAHNADGTSTFLSLDGQLLRPLGQDVPIGTRAFVVEGRVIGPAPTLPSTTQFV